MRSIEFLISRFQKREFPWAFFFCLMTYIVLLFIENILLTEATISKIRVAKKIQSHYNRIQDIKHQMNLFYEPRFMNKNNPNDNSNKQNEIVQDSKVSVSLTVIAMSLQVFVTGITLGILKYLNHLLMFLLAMLIHSFATTIILSAVVRWHCKSQARKILYTLIYSVSSPIGIYLGWQLAFDDLTISILYSVSCGSLLYLCLNDIIVQQFSLRENRWKKFFSFFLGVLTENIIFLLSKIDQSTL